MGGGEARSAWDAVSNLLTAPVACAFRTQTDSHAPDRNRDQGVRLYGDVILENHLHCILQSSDLEKEVKKVRGIIWAWRV